MTSCTAPDLRAPVSDRLAHPHRRVAQPSRGHQSAWLMMAERRPRRRSDPEQDAGTRHWRGCTGWPPRSSHTTCRRGGSMYETFRVAALWWWWMDGRTAGPVRDCVRARGRDRRPCVGGQGTRAPSRPGATPGVRSGDHTRVSTAGIRAHGTNSAMDLESQAQLAEAVVHERLGVRRRPLE